MALAGRSARRGGGGGRRIVALAVLVTLVVLLVDASIKSRSTDPVRQLAAQAWIDQTLPLIGDSTAQGREVVSLVTDGLTMPDGTLAAQARRTATSARATYEAATKLAGPTSIDAEAGLLEACLLVRAEAAESTAKVIVSTLAGGATHATIDSAAAALISAEQSALVGDKAYQLFSQNLPPLGVVLPPSTWATTGPTYGSARLAVYLQALQATQSLAARHRLEVLSVATEPPAETLSGSVQVLPLSSSISVSIVVGNGGNRSEGPLTVTATIAPALRNVATAREFITALPSGTARALTIGLLYPPSGTPVTLTVTVSGPAGSAVAPASRSLTFEMPSPKVAIATTTTTAAPPVGTAPVSVGPSSGQGAGSGSGSGSGSSGTTTTTSSTASTG